MRCNYIITQMEGGGWTDDVKREGRERGVYDLLYLIKNVQEEKSPFGSTSLWRAMERENSHGAGVCTQLSPGANKLISYV